MPTSGSPVSRFVWIRIFPMRTSLHTSQRAGSSVSPARRMLTPQIYDAIQCNTIQCNAIHFRGRARGFPRPAGCLHPDLSHNTIRYNTPHRGRILGSPQPTGCLPRRSVAQYNTIKKFTTFMHVSNYYTLNV